MGFFFFTPLTCRPVLQSHGSRRICSWGPLPFFFNLHSPPGSLFEPQFAFVLWLDAKVSFTVFCSWVGLVLLLNQMFLEIENLCPPDEPFDASFSCVRLFFQWPMVLLGQCATNNLHQPHPPNPPVFTLGTTLL